MIEGFAEKCRSYLGAISQEEQDAVYGEISAGSRPSNEYFIMLVISALIATIGLLTNSVAVIIGAMLVSPLLIPVLGISLGAVKGDFALFYRAIEAEAKGAAIVVCLVAALTLLIPTAGITSEIMLRTQPTPLDLLVALASGAAAAYALTKRNIGAALPGVAIAVAIMPPLCVVGIGFALKHAEIALGGGLTFLANVVAINFAASVVFWLMNFGAGWSFVKEKETMRRLKTSAALLLIISVPLAWIMWDSFSSATTKTAIDEVISSQIDGIEGARLVDYGFEWKGGAMSVSATIESSKYISSEKADEMRLALEKNLKAKVALSLRVDVVEIVRSGPS
ncbi:MAG: DUF389 domain-containing protein [Candidatus Micrarchaeia archaeon]